LIILSSDPMRASAGAPIILGQRGELCDSWPVNRPRSRSRSRVRTAGVALLALAPVVAGLSLVVAPGPTAQAATPGTYRVTFVARQCPTYQDITANLARNNIQESLQDLGANTAYTSGQPISPSVETPNQPNCTALANWQFTFGNGINGRTPGTNLSRVSNPVSPSFTTQAAVPLLDTSGNPTGSSIDGAVTTTLTQAQVTAASQHNLWVQGGTPADPLGTAAFGNRYAFGALRCAVDNLNGDNVEWVGFPTGQSHVFCYYYAVDQLPQPGTIQINKVLTNAGVSIPAFPFTGTVSYNPGGNFTVQAGSSVSFARDSTVDWNFQEQALAGYSFTSAVCTSQNGESTFNGRAASIASPVTFPTNVLIDVNLAPADAAVCTYTNTRNVVDLTVLKETVGGTGTFDFTVTPPAGATTVVTATTTTEGVPAEACIASTSTCDVVDNPASLPADYTITEVLPAPTAAGSWAVTAFDCNGGSQPAGPTQTVTVTTALENLACTFTDTFTPTGSITLTKTTVGGTGTTEFSIFPVPPVGESETADPVYSATTTAAGVPAPATQIHGDYSLDSLDLGQFSVVESGPDNSPAGTWSPQGIACNGTFSAPTSSDVLVTLTVADPHVTCAFTNAFVATPPATTTTTAAPVTTTTVPSGAAATDTGANGSGNGQALAMTGEDVRLPLAVALFLAAAGGGLLVVDRARRRRTALVVVDRRDDRPPT
jgi:hypothetical protein